MWGVMVFSYILMLISFISIIVAAYLGYLSSNQNHILISLFASIIYMLSQTLILFYFITSGSKIKEIIKNNNLDISKYYQPVLDMKMKLFPHIMVNMIIIGVTFIIGGAVHNNIISPLIHSLGFFTGIFHYTWLIILQHRCFIKNTEVVILVCELANDN